MFNLTVWIFGFVAFGMGAVFGVRLERWQGRRFRR
jgi:hypothetical protein